MFDFLVIGKGLFGSAAAKYLSLGNSRVGIIGPDEPQDVAAHKGAFASHYDQGRLTGVLSRGPVWSKLAFQADQQYAGIEKASGIPFYTPAGRLHMPADQVDPAQLALACGDYGLDYQYLTTAEQVGLFPYLRFPDAEEGILEKNLAGYLNPRNLIRAQLAIAAQHGATIVPEMAAAVVDVGQYLQITTLSGRVFQTRKVLIAAGAFSNCWRLLPRQLKLRIKSETILLAEVTAQEAARLHGMPAVGYAINSPVLDDIYLLPPLQYPDGRYYAKMGCNTAADQFFTTFEEMRAWFVSGDSDIYAADLQDALQSILPDLKINSFITKRCIVTYTARGLPYIDEVQPGKIYVAVGGNGTGAKSSDAIGRLAADLLQRGEFSAGFERAWFAVN
jgi:sarcosine oxidase